MEQIMPGIWSWTARHPGWKPGYDWPGDVSSFAIDDGEQLLVFDPIAPPPRIEELARARTATVVLTCPWHARDGVGLASRIDAPLHVPPPDPDKTHAFDGIVYRVGDTLAQGIEVRPGAEPNDLVLWLPRHGVIVVGDTLIDRGDGLMFPRDWATRNDHDPDVVLEGLQPLLELPIEGVLATHGGLFDSAALLRAIS